MNVRKSFSTQAVLGAAAASVWAGSLALAGNVNTLTGSDLSQPTSWSLGTVPTITDDALITSAFPTTTAALTLTSTASNTFTGTFNSLNVTSSRAITIENFSAANPNTASLTLGGAGSTTNSAAPSGTDLLYVSGTSTLTLVSSASFGSFNLATAQSGTFDIAGTATLGGPLTVAAGTTLNANVAGTLNLGGGVTLATGTTLVKNGAGTLNLSGGANSASFAGALTINAGTVEYVSASTAPAVGAAVTLSGGTLQYSNAGNQFVTSNGRFNIALTAGTTSGLGTRNTSTTGNRLINAFGTGGVILSGGGNLNIVGSTTVSLSAVEFTTANTYTGATNVGSLQMLLLGTGGSAASSNLNLAGGTFGVLATHATGQVVANTAIGVGGAVIETFSSTGGTVTPGTTGSGTYNLGNLTRVVGGTADVVTGGVFATSAVNSGAGNLAGGYLTSGNGAAFATIGAGGVIAPYSGYTAASADYTATTAATEFDAATSGTFTGSAVDSIRFAAAAPVTATASALTVASGGILVTPSVGVNATAIAGGTLTAGSGSELIVHQYNNIAGGATTITSGIVDNGGAVALTKAGPGTLILDGSNTFTGATYITGGTLQVGNNDALGSLSFTQPIVNFGALVINRSDSPTITGLISGAGSVFKTGSGVLTLSNASNSFTGQIEVAQGTLAFSNTLSLNGNSTANRLLIDNGATLRFTNTGTFTLAKGITITGTATIDTVSGVLNQSGSIIGTGTLLKVGTGTLTSASTASSFTTLNIQAGTFRVNATGGALGASGANNVNEIGDAGTLEFNLGIAYTGSRNIQLDGPNSTIQTTNGTTSFSSAVVVSGSGALNKSGTGTLNLNTSNSYSGGTVVKNGTLSGTVVGAFGGGGLTINPTGTTAAGSATANSTGALAGGVNVTVNNNGLALGTLNLLDAAPVVGSLAGSGQVNLGTATLLTVGNGTSTIFSGTIAGSGSITKVGASTLSLTGPNTYTGTTTVASAASTLSVKYASTGLSAATPLLSGAGGTDIQNGTVVFDYTGDTSPAITIRGLLANSFTAGSGVMSGGQLRSSTATAARGLGYADTGSAVIVKAALFGDADLDGGVSINDFNALAGNFGQATGKVWVDGDFDYDGGVSINDFNLLAGNFGQTLPASSDAFASLLAFAAAHNDLASFEAVTGVPEPTSLGLIAAGATLGLRRRRRA